MADGMGMGMGMAVRHASRADTMGAMQMDPGLSVHHPLPSTHYPLPETQSTALDSWNMIHGPRCWQFHFPGWGMGSGSGRTSPNASTERNHGISTRLPTHSMVHAQGSTMRVLRHILFGALTEHFVA
jgi:hypothetical protein